MATLYITEHELMTINGVQVVRMPPLKSQTVAIGAGAASSSAFTPCTEMVRLNNDSTCSIEFGGVVATTSSARMTAGQTEYFAVKAGDSVSVISNS